MGGFGPPRVETASLGASCPWPAPRPAPSDADMAVDMAALPEKTVLSENVVGALALVSQGGDQLEPSLRLVRTHVSCGGHPDPCVALYPGQRASPMARTAPPIAGSKTSFGHGPGGKGRLMGVRSQVLPQSPERRRKKDCCFCSVPQ